MGLDAVVFLNMKNLASNLPLDKLCLDRRTGEVWFRNDVDAQTYCDENFKAIDRRLGNVAMLAKILDEVSEFCPPGSILRGKVLKSFSHSGDVIHREELETLHQEVQLIKKQTEAVRSVALREFLEALEQLITTAKEQQNPIVFV